MRRTVTLIVLAALLTGIWLAFKLLPWWAIILGILVLVVVGKLLIGRVLRSLLTIPFKAKGAVLRDAKAQVNAITPLANNDAAANRSRFDLDVTITPAVASGSFTHWEPCSLTLAPFDSKFDIDKSDGDECEIESTEVEQEGQFQPDEGMKYPGPQRLKLRLAVKDGTSVLKFRYYFEEFGEVRLPPVVAAAA
jgi:hypothetical protein